MKVLALIRRCLLILGLCLKNVDNKNYGVVTNWLIISLLIGFLVITIEYMWSHFDDRANALYAFMQFVTFVTVWTCYICFAMKKRATLMFLNELQVIVNDYWKREKNYSFYAKAEFLSHQITKWPPIIFFASFYGVIIISVVNIIVSDVIPSGTELHPGNWYTFYKMSAPFDRDTLFGFIMFFIIQAVLLHCYYAGLIPSFSFFLGSCFYLDACCFDLAEQFARIDKIVCNRNYAECDVQIKLTKIVKFHVKIIELFQLLARIFSGIIFFQLACGAAFISSTVFQLDIAWGNFNGNFFVIVCVIVLSVMSIFPYCYYATQILSRLQAIGDSAYESQWFTYSSPKLQKYIQMIIAYSQMKRNFYGFGIFTCSLETFRKIANASASYYLMLKKF